MHALLKPLSVRLLAVPFSPFAEKSRVFSPDVCRNDPLENSSLVNAWNFPNIQHNTITAITYTN